MQQTSSIRRQFLFLNVLVNSLRTSYRIISWLYAPCVFNAVNIYIYTYTHQVVFKLIRNQKTTTRRRRRFVNEWISLSSTTKMIVMGTEKHSNKNLISISTVVCVGGFTLYMYTATVNSEVSTKSTHHTCLPYKRKREYNL